MPTPLPTKPQKIEHFIFAVFEEDVADMIAALKPAHAGFLQARGFTGKSGNLVVLPSGLGSNEMGGMWAWFGLGARKAFNPLTFRALPTQLPKGTWKLKVEADLDLHAIHVAWGLGSYSFGTYKASSKPVEARLDDGDLTQTEREEIALEVLAHDRVRDLVNTPANDMGPPQIEAAARAIAKAHGADIGVIAGELLKQSYPAVYAVGKAAAPENAPRLIEIAWKPAKPRGVPPVVCLVGKGVAFDTGGLNIKTAGMGLMKKDMGGAAHVLALAEWIMASQLNVDLHVLIPAVENAISGNAMRPGDVLHTRAGLTVEVGNTDAEGRLILADALTRAAELEPALTIDFATLTGAARVALGPDVIPFYCDDEEVVRQLEIASIAQFDPLWRMPLWAGYNDALDSDIADLKNDPSAWAQAGSVTAALFLQRFAPKSGAWVHLDVFAWNPRGRAGAPVGAEAQALRAVYALIRAY
ncbi:cytochrome C oxidase subunit II [Asticcacaulis sp. AC460]|uniref:leucyl aminopeptidase family protein n=1 Tax=Asticcacaulis sp. AC460 TaxID=1282360 RepID=UPI0003C41248|nr:leucyl aminopeptidase family protein [Asticcacaulis sp. AC460]ESQ92608.1 cytochrome C oxidase subunit II [Asticcacaulis sp. AC460]